MMDKQQLLKIRENMAQENIPAILMTHEIPTLSCMIHSDTFHGISEKEFVDCPFCKTFKPESKVMAEVNKLRYQIN